MVHIPGWPDDAIHADFEQVKRIQTGLKIKQSDVIDHGDYFKIKGSSGDYYHVTLTSCTCRDFYLRGYPCKHIYCMAAAKGHLNGLPETKAKREQAFHAADELERLRQLYISGDIEPDAYVKIGDALTKAAKIKSTKAPRFTPIRYDRREEERSWRKAARALQKGQTLHQAQGAIDMIAELKRDGKSVYSADVIKRARDIVAKLPEVPLVLPASDSRIELMYGTTRTANVSVYIDDARNDVLYVEDGTAELRNGYVSALQLPGLIKTFISTYLN